MHQNIATLTVRIALLFRHNLLQSAIKDVVASKHHPRRIALTVDKADFVGSHDSVPCGHLAGLLLLHGIIDVIEVEIDRTIDHRGNPLLLEQRDVAGALGIPEI
ncbi:hypothetical protein [Chelativorans sp. J32]|uniref:hypothetical protein n=1 Tax=Chelativorans sp. J32 TaxID=935840 RepID=UPI0035276525